MLPPLQTSLGITIPPDLRAHGGRRTEMRLLRLTDQELLSGMLQRLSAETLFLRYGAPRPRLSPEMARKEAAQIARGRHAGSLALLVTLPTAAGEEAIALAELARRADYSERAEIAVVVADAYQRRGIGLALCAQLLALAPHLGITQVEAEVLATNTRMRALLRRLAIPAHVESVRETLLISYDLAGARSSFFLAHKKTD